MSNVRPELRKLTSLALTALDLDRIDFIRQKCGLRTVTDAIRQALVDAVEMRGGLNPLAPVIGLAPPVPPPEVETKLCRCGVCGTKFRVPVTEEEPVCPNPSCGSE